jgi:hypothetical protein
MTALQYVLAIAAVLVALILVVDIVRDQQNSNPAFFGLCLLEAGLVLQFVWGLVQLFGDHRGVSVAPYAGYLVGALFILPIGYLWSLAEKSRSGTAVLLVAVLVLPVLFLRLHDLWSAHV